MREYGQFPLWRSFTALAVTAVLLATAARFALAPIKKRIAERYVGRGDTYFGELQFKEAQQEYRNALDLDPQSLAAKDSLQLATDSVHDLKSGLPFFQSHHDDSVVERLQESLKPYQTPKEALAEGVKLYADGEYSFARYPLERAVQLDPGYPEAWNYLALTYGELAKEDPEMQSKVKDAEAKRDSLTVKYIQQAR